MSENDIYLVFQFDTYYPDGGIADLLTIVSNEEEAKKYISIYQEIVKEYPYSQYESKYYQYYKLGDARFFEFSKYAENKFEERSFSKDQPEQDLSVSTNTELKFQEWLKENG